MGQIKQVGPITLITKGVRMTFYTFPYKIDYSKRFEGVIKMPDLLVLAAMKAYALGRRAKWKDYADLYFIFRHYSLEQIIGRAEKIFGGEFNERLFREQLSYHADINYSEPIEYLPGMDVADEVVKRELKQIAIS